MTEAESRLWQRLRARQIYGLKFRRQHPIGRYILDFACIEIRLAIEVDGGQHNDLQAQDSARTEWLETQGWKVLRFWNNEVLNSTNDVLEEIHRSVSTLLQEPPIPSP